MLGLGRNRVAARWHRRPGADAAPKLMPDALGSDDRLHPGRQRQHRGVRSGWRDLSACPRDRRLGPCRRRLRFVGGRLSSDSPSSPTASARPIRGLLTPTRRSTFPTTTASPSSATSTPCGPRWRSPPSTCQTTSTRRNPSDYTPELSRRARGVDVWAALRQLGSERASLGLVEGCHRNADAHGRRD